MLGRTFDAVVFDMDGVLCDSEPSIAAAAAEMLRRRYGVVATREDFLPPGARPRGECPGFASRHEHVKRADGPPRGPGLRWRRHSNPYLEARPCCPRPSAR